ncbi:MAG: hypothetical protein COA54_00425 [Thiotrichaceae bacterium]|nr:MAG: hypothetical protein COA54_00425 [Thiotrichaceae bacterium]
MMNSFRLTTLLSLVTSSSLALAGGPLVLEGSNGNTPVTYQDPNITIHAEAGPLGSLNNAQANTLMREAFDLWNSVDTATINLALNEGLIDVDIDIDNFLFFLPDPNGSESKADDGRNPTVYDDDGKIIDAFFGDLASDSTIGFAASFFSANGDFFIEGYAVINGKDLGLTSTEFKLLVAHEIGHLIGMDHSQANIDNNETDFGSPFICSTDSLDSYPVMYPFVCRDEETLHADDISAISALYPAANFATSFGIIEGRFVDENGGAILGANIWAENTTTGDVVSIVSDYLLQGTGFYQLHLTPGTYTLHANSINPLFNGGSSIGPYSLSLTDASFIAPHPITEVTLQAEVAGAEMISVIASQTVTLNLSVTGNSVELEEISGGGSGGGTISGLVSLILLSLLAAGRRFNTNKN